MRTPMSSSQMKRFFDDLRTPGLVVRIAERHRDVHNQVAPGGSSSSLRICSTSARDSVRDMLALARRKYAEIEYGISQRGDAARGQRAFDAFVVHHDADDFRRLRAGGQGREECFDHRFAIGHLRDMFWGNETHRVDVAKTCLAPAFAGTQP